VCFWVFPSFRGSESLPVEICQPNSCRRICHSPWPTMLLSMMSF
jgi:hypothetical protein